MHSLSSHPDPLEALGAFSDRCQNVDNHLAIPRAGAGSLGEEASGQGPKQGESPAFPGKAHRPGRWGFQGGLKKAIHELNRNHVGAPGG